MKFKPGIPATELRPFSVEDPTGTRPRAPLGRTRTRAREGARQAAARAPTQPRSSTPRAAARPRTSVKRQEQGGPSVLFPAQSSATPEKKTGWLTLIIIVSLMAAGTVTAVPFLLRSYNQSQLREEGELAHARIISVTPTDVSVNQDRVYEIEAELTLPNHQPFTSTVQQSFSAPQVNLLRPDSWVEIRYNPESSAEFVITTLAIVAPASVPALVAEPNPTTEPNPGNVPEPSSADAQKPTAANDASAVKNDNLSCEQARACCRIISPDNQGCDSYLHPHIPAESCRLALGAYTKAATALGKSCQGF